MRTIELTTDAPSVHELVEAVQEDDIVLLRDGRPQVRLEKFSDEDWGDWEYEHSAAALERGRRGREQYARGEYLALDQIKRKYEID